MFRKLILASAVSLVLLPCTSEALGLGGIRSQSALNEPFVGEIELLDVKPDELDAVKVRLAPDEDFSKVGADRSHFLTNLRFRPRLSPQGRSVISVTSSDPVREPFLDFLIEVNWPKGRLVKEFTVLLDPPVTSGRRPPPVERPAVASPVPVQVAPVGQRQEKSAVPPSSRPAASPIPAGVNTAAFPLRYGPIAAGEGLLRIARRLAPLEATVAQTAMALYRNNQHAFIGGDINRVRLGERLEIPSAPELFALDQGDAEREFRAALRGDRVTATPLTDVTAATAAEDRLKIAAATPPEAAAPAEVPPREEGEPELGAIQKELLLVQETGESTRQETQELRDRIRDLESQLADIRRLLQLRNEQLAQLQAAGVPQTGVAESAGAQPEAESPPKTEPIRSAPAETLPESAELAGATRDEPVGPSEEANAASQKKSEPSPPEVPEEPAAPWWESVPMPALGLGLGAPLLLALFGWTILKRRKRIEESLEAGGLGREAKISQPVSGAAAGVSATASRAPRGPEASHMVAPYTGFGDLEEESEDADVISEADVYIAYGRYREAQSLLDEEISRSPDRLDLKYKLAETYYGARDLAALRSLMDEMLQTGGDRINPDQWRRLVAMADELEHGEPASATGNAFAVTPPSQRTDSWGRPSETEAFGGPESGLDLSYSFPGSEARGTAHPGRDLELEVEDLDLPGASLELPEQGDVQARSESASDLELKLEDLERFGKGELEEIGALERDSREPSAGVPAPFEMDSHALRVDSLEIPQVGKDSVPSDILSSQWQMDSGIWDEVATKIDLARAYMEMEDSDAARAILEEVAEEGNEEQRAEGREILARLA